MSASYVRRLLHRAGSLEIFPWLELLASWWELARQRRDLAALDDRALQDVGLSRSDIEGEISKPFWRR